MGSAAGVKHVQSTSRVNDHATQVLPGATNVACITAGLRIALLDVLGRILKIGNWS